MNIIMFQSHSHQILQEMMRLNNNSDQNRVFCDSESRYYLNNLSYDQDPIEMFLNEEAFYDKCQQIKQIDSSCELSNTHDATNLHNIEEIKETHQNPKKKSIFHNFQKHLITLIKKFINLSQKDEEDLDGSQLASQLWAAFMKTRSFNKKILHMVFGVLQNCKIDQEFARLCEQFPEFRAIYNRNSISDIVEAQRIIREHFVSHALGLSKQEVESKCNVNRFQEFYEYYQSFIGELRSGPMTKRMTKSRKFGVVERLECNLTQQ